MNCADVERLSTAYQDAELDGRTASALRGHLRVCTACARRVADEAAVCDAAAELGAIDPPPALWEAIEGRLAELEIADARRSLLGRWWDRARPYAVPATVVGLLAGLAVVGLVAPWRDRGGRDGPAEHAGAPIPAARQGTAAKGGDAGALTLTEQTVAEVRRTQERYKEVSRALRAQLEPSRGHRSRGQTGRFERQLRELEVAVRGELDRLTAHLASDPRLSDRLASLRREEIRLLREIAVEEFLP